jgi:hypothetical protein
MGKHHFFVILLSLLALAGCRPVSQPPGTVPPGTVPPPTPHVPEEIALGEQFSLVYGAGAVLQEDGLLLVFTGVAEDSRCPADVTCVQAGSVAVDVRIELSGEQPQTVRLGGQTDKQGNVTGVGQDGTVSSTAIVDGYTLELSAVNPYPTQAAPPSPADYVITLVVNQAQP